MKKLLFILLMFIGFCSYGQTTFTKDTNGKVIMDDGTNKFGFDPQYSVLPELNRYTNAQTGYILIAPFPQATQYQQVYRVLATDVTVPAHSGVNDLIEKLSMDFFFEPLAAGIADTSHWALLVDSLYPKNLDWRVGIATASPQYGLDVDTFAEIGTSKFRMAVLPDWMVGPLTVPGVGMGAAGTNFVGTVVFGLDTVSILSRILDASGTNLYYNVATSTNIYNGWVRNFTNPTVARTGLFVDSTMNVMHGKGTKDNTVHTSFQGSGGGGNMVLWNSGRLQGNVANNDSADLVWAGSAFSPLMQVDVGLNRVGIKTDNPNFLFDVNGQGHIDTLSVGERQQDSVYTIIYHGDIKTTGTLPVTLFTLPIPTDASVIVEATYTARELGTNDSRMGQVINGWTNDGGTVVREGTLAGVGNSFGSLAANVQLEFLAVGTDGIILVDGPAEDVAWAVKLEITYNLKMD